MFSLHTLYKHSPNHYHRILRTKMSRIDPCIAVENDTLEIFCSWNVHFFRFAHDDDEMTCIHTHYRKTSSCSLNKGPANLCNRIGMKKPSRLIAAFRLFSSIFFTPKITHFFSSFYPNILGADIITYIVQPKRDEALSIGPHLLLLLFWVHINLQVCLRLCD